MLIKFDADDALVAQLKAFTGQAVGSKAFHTAARDALDLAAEVRELRRQLDASRATVLAQRQLIERARSSAAQLLEVASQGELGLVP